VRRANLGAGLHQSGFTDVEVRDRPSWLAREHALWEEAVTLDPGDDPALQSLHAEGVKSLQWTALLREARASGLSPKSDADLPPVLLKLIGGVAPAARWPAHLGKKEKKDRAREAAQSPEIKEDWKRKRQSAIWVWMHQSPPGPRYASLKTELNALANSLARNIDAAPEPIRR
jgi:hypothetical protein